jgi:hypothetical protein
MITQNLYVGNLISAINQFTDVGDDVCEWGEWMVSYAVDCAISNKIPDYREKLIGIAGEEFADEILSDHMRDFRRIELAVRNLKDDFFDYSVTSLGVNFVGH